MNRDLDPVEIEKHLRAGAVERSLHHSADWRVSEKVLSELLQCSPLTLKYWRSVGEGPRYTRIPIHGSRFSYQLADVADWIVSMREER